MDRPLLQLWQDFLVFYDIPPSVVDVCLFTDTYHHHQGSRQVA
jgi:hypothetical protein